MAVALEQFVKHLTDSGVISPGRLENFIPPKAHPKDAQELARQLVQSKYLTKFQAAEIYQGRAKSLILGNYTILDKIGAGGMGQVFKAQHRRMDRIVAIKMLPKNVMKDPATVARFEREVRAAAKLRHSHIVATDDADEANGVHFLVMEYIEGSDLSALVKANGPVSVAKAINYILQAARGLEFAHGEGVIHRDIKPANLLLDKKGTVKILDMGLARISTDGDAATQAELTGTGAVMGTVDYMAPEQALSTKHATAQADIYSLGCTLHYLLAGKAIYDGDSLMAKLLAHREQPIPLLGSDVPEQIQAIFAKMVAKNADDRYQTMSEVVADLQECVSAGSTVGGSKTSVEVDSEISSLSFLQNAPAKKAATHTANKKPVKAVPAAGKGITRNGKLAIVGGGLLALIVLAGVLVKIRTKDGTLVVEIDQPDAVVQVLNEEGKVEITRPGEKGTLSVSVDPGKHRLRVEKDGFVVYGQDFVLESGGTQSIKATLEEDKPWFMPEFKKWEQKTAALTAEQQIKAVSEKLVELNPGFDGTLREQIEAGVVIAVNPPNDHLIDISPLRAFSKLKALQLFANDPQVSQLADLSPLTGMQITDLRIGWSKVTDLKPINKLPLATLLCQAVEFADLSPLAGMSLTSLDCSGTKVSELSPLAGMPLTTLKFDRTPVSNLAPLKGMQLTTLSFCNTKVSDLSPLIGMPLNVLTCYGTPISDLSPLAGMRLTDLSCGFTQISELSPLKEMPLALLDIGETQVSDLSPLAGMPLTYFGCSGTGVSDLSPLKGTKLTTLNIQRTKASTLLPLMGLPLKSFDCSGTQVADLSPLKGMQLTELSCVRTGVADLSPLAGMSISRLQCDNSKVNDLKPLAGMQLTFLSLGGCSLVSDVSPLEGMPLTFLHLGGTKVTPASVEALIKTLPDKCDVRWDKPADEGKAWKSPAFKKWEQEVAALPAEEQVKAVAKKLQELNPAFDGTIRGNYGDDMPKIENGIVTELGFFTDHVSDISPVRAIPSLKILICGGNWPAKGILSDLSPLEGLSLTVLGCGSTAVSDLSPLKDMPLVVLNCTATLVTDLSPLRGMRLKNLSCVDTRVSSLSPLSGMPLQSLQVSSTSVASLSPVEGMPLTELWAEGTKVSDLSPLQGMKLIRLRFTPKDINKGIDIVRQMKSLSTIGVDWQKQLAPAEFWKKYDAGEFGKPEATKATAPTKPSATYKDPAFKKWEKDVAALTAEEQVKAVVKKLQELNPGFDGKVMGWKTSDVPKIEDGQVTEIGFLTDNVSDISPVRAFRFLHALWCPCSWGGKGKLNDLSPLKRMKLRKVHCDASPVSDLSPLMGMQLTHLSCGTTLVADLSPLKGMPLEYVNCGTTHVADLTPLEGMEIRTLFCDRTAISDLLPLKAMKLESLVFHTTAVSDLSPLGGMPLKQLVFNETPVSDVSPLKGMNLEFIALTPSRIAKGMEHLRQMDGLKEIGVDWDHRLSPHEFWRKYDAGEFGKPHSPPTTIRPSRNGSGM